MKRLLLLTIVLLIGVVGAQASPTAQTNSPAITSFTSSVGSVERDALANRAARIPVSWTTTNRPLTSNLYFEQVLPDGSAINVELPRTNPWVNSSGNGTAAPILPDGNQSQITLRVRLVNLLTGQVLSERQLTFTITTGSGTQPGNNNRPSITRFVTSAANVRAAQLANGTARVPVSWTAVNRPVTSNLVFEQILTDGSVVNVELPRENPWVNSTGDGVAAPVAPGGNATSIRLRVRLFDLITSRVLDQREFTLGIDSAPAGQPNIRTFTSSATSMDAGELAARTARVPVTWAVDNRPDNSNLIFEQVLPGGTVINVELPRTVPIVPSSGNGTAAPILPSGVGEILLRVRLVNLRDNATIAQREITLPIRGSVGTGTVVVDPSQCYTTPFPTTNNFTVGGRGRVLTASLPALTTPLTNQTAGTLQQNDTFSILSGPYCYYLNPAPGPDQQGNFRMWRVRGENRSVEGWIQEYAITIAGVTRNIEPTNGGTVPPTITPVGGVQIRSFTASPNPVARGGAVTFSWDVANATSISITRLSERGGIYIESIAGNLPAAGTYTYTLPADYINRSEFVLLTNDAQINQYVTVNITCPFTTSFIADDCPITQQTVPVAYQSFENGHMVWRGDTREIFVLFNDGTYQIVRDTWVEGEVFGDGRTPPEGRIAPARGFGKLWFSDTTIQQRLGWATAAEQSYTNTWETHKFYGGRSEFTSNVFQFPGGRIVFVEDRWRS